MTTEICYQNVTAELAAECAFILEVFQKEEVPVQRLTVLDFASFQGRLYLQKISQCPRVTIQAKEFLFGREFLLKIFVPLQEPTCYEKSGCLPEHMLLRRVLIKAREWFLRPTGPTFDPFLGHPAWLAIYAFLLLGVGLRARVSDSATEYCPQERHAGAFLFSDYPG